MTENQIIPIPLGNISITYIQQKVNSFLVVMLGYLLTLQSFRFKFSLKIVHETCKFIVIVPGYLL